MAIGMVPDLVINLNAISHNWLLLNAKLSTRVRCGAVVKANAYGLGVGPVVKALVKVGCQDFYVASVREGVQVKTLLDGLTEEYGLVVAECRVIVFSGCAAGEELLCMRQRLIPVLVSAEMVHRWFTVVERAGLRHGSVRAALKVDTGMGRLGLCDDEYRALLATPERLRKSGVEMLMSHLACADQADHPQNHHQLQRFQTAYKFLLQKIPEASASLANSAGVLLGRDFHFDAVRPGIALYGGNPQPEVENALKPVVSLRLPVIQVKKLLPGGYLGYGATYQVKAPMKTAVIGGGYADGLLRAMSGRGVCYVSCRQGGEGWLVPIVGRLSMDSTILDITGVPEGALQVGDRVEFMGEHIGIDAVANAAGTIAYEILTSLGDRYQRSYLTW